jgi:hypothetical protein
VRTSAERARRRAAKVVARRGFPDEEVVELDHGNERRSGVRCDLIATDHAVYVREPGVRQIFRFAYEEMALVRIDDFEIRGRYPGRLDFVDRNGSRYSFDHVEHSNGVLPRYVRDAWSR